MTKKSTNTADEHFPVRNGLIYCAPFCGRGCTYKSFRAATISAARIANHLGPDWAPHVWENLGWHWSVRSKDGQWKLHPVHSAGKKGGYIAFLGAGESGGRWAEHGNTPREAMLAVLGRAHDDLRDIANLIVNVPRIT